MSGTPIKDKNEGGVRLPSMVQKIPSDCGADDDGAGFVAFDDFGAIGLLVYEIATTLALRYCSAINLRCDV